MILRRIGAVLVGVIVAVVIVQVTELGVHMMYPPPPGYNMRDMNAMKAFVAKLPAPAFILVLVAATVVSVGQAYRATRAEQLAVVTILDIGRLQRFTNNQPVFHPADICGRANHDGVNHPLANVVFHHRQFIGHGKCGRRRTQLPAQIADKHHIGGSAP